MDRRKYRKVAFLVEKHEDLFDQFIELMAQQNELSDKFKKLGVDIMDVAKFVDIEMGEYLRKSPDVTNAVVNVLNKNLTVKKS